MTRWPWREAEVRNHNAEVQELELSFAAREIGRRLTALHNGGSD
jgi:hypothetical protein